MSDANSNNATRSLVFFRELVWDLVYISDTKKYLIIILLEIAYPAHLHHGKLVYYYNVGSKQNCLLFQDNATTVNEWCISNISF